MKCLLQECVGKQTIVTTKHDNSSERYGLKTLKCPKQVKDLVPFENDLIEMLKVIKFQKVKNQFLPKLKKDIKTVKQSKKH